MSRAVIDLPYDWEEAVRNLITEDDEPVDSILSEKQMRLLTEPLYDNWTPPLNEDEPDERRVFLAAANVGVFSSPFQPPLVPDMFLSLDVEPNPEWYGNEHRAYFVWEFDKAPEVVVEIVSNRKGGELAEKMRRYARMDVTYYVVYDPWRLLSDDVLRLYERGFGKRYRQRKNYQLPEVGLSLTLWQGVFEMQNATWLRWCDPEGKLILTGAESRLLEAERANQAEKRAIQAQTENAKLRAENERLRRQLKPKKRNK